MYAYIKHYEFAMSRAGWSGGYGKVCIIMNMALFKTHVRTMSMKTQ